MGILDDAIREHLELKRKHGVPEEEVERQQEEALGPARREVAQQPEDAEIAAEAADDASLFDGEDNGAPEAEARALAADESGVAEAPDPSAPAVEPPAAEPPVDETPVDAPAPTDPPPLAAEPAPEPDAHAALGDTEPHGFPSLDDELHDDDAIEDEQSHEDPPPPADVDEDELDVLEDTPDFLQETPEHDRLWFEQKPPRDFDFD
jgi:hypothetical protein